MRDSENTTLIMAIERLAESQERLTENQSDMAKEIKELTKAISKMDVVMEKLVHLEDRHERSSGGINTRIDKIEEDQAEGIKPSTMKNLVYTMIAVAVGYGSYNEARINNLHTLATTTLQEQRHIIESIKVVSDAEQENKNQITYLKGKVR